MLSSHLRVHCRTGSLEIAHQDESHRPSVHCRTGSLENHSGILNRLSCVHCRTGSLEISRPPTGFLLSVHCRTGSLETRSIGVSPKVQQVRVINYVASAVNADYGDVTDDKYQTKENGFNFDLGVSNDFGNGLTTGLVVKNLIKRDIAAPIVNGVQAQYEIGPAPTASVTYKVGGGLTVSSDLDLLPQKRFTSLSGTTSQFNASDDDQQMWSAGLEEDILGWLQLRAGYRHDLKGNLDDAFTVGVGISPFKVFHLDVAGIYGGKDEVGAVVQTSFTF